MTDPIATTRTGFVRGMSKAGVEAFLGIPYAAPPVGALRFREPAPHAPWTGVRDATRPGATPPQPEPPTEAFKDIELEGLLGDGLNPGDDYLTVNVWKPAGDITGAPVMVWIYGGGWVSGTNSAPLYDGATFARDGVVCVALNHRVGIDGFLVAPGVPTNLGLRDQIAALKWVQDNIAAFGGDPARVTLFGESSGAMSVADLLVSPPARGLFRRAILQSGHCSMTRSIPTTRKIARKLAKKMGVAATRDGFASRTIEQTIAALEWIQKPTSGPDLRDETGREPAFGVSKFVPVHGDDVIPVKPLEALRAGAGAEVDLLLGSTTEEMNLYLVPTGARKKIGNLLAWFVLSRSMPKARAILKAYGLGRKGRKAGEVLGEALSDLMFRWPVRVTAAAHKGRTWVYEFGWRSPACDGELGACHALEIPFVFDTLACVTGPKGLVGPNPPQELADRMHRIWVDFARDGAIPWAQFDGETRQVQRLETGVTATEKPMPAAPYWG
jgi:para-nitrobenzyl esterase